MTADKTTRLRYHCRIWVFVLYFATLLLSFFRRELFFYLDEYAGIWRLAQAPSLFRFMLEPHNEHFTPLFHAFWAYEVYLFQENYSFYILTNVVLFACMAMLWERWLREVGVPTPIAVMVPLVAMTCLAQADNVMCGWQACMFLSSIALIGILRAWHQSRIGYLVVLSVCAGFCFSSTDALPLVFACFFMVDYLRDRKNHAAFLRAIIFLTAFGLLVAAAIWAGGAGGGMRASLWTGPTFLQKALHLSWLFWYTVSIAFYGPVQHLLLATTPSGPNFAATLVSLVFLAGIPLLASWHSPRRSLVIKLLIMQFALFMLISPFRNTPVFVGFSGRYYTLGLIPVLSAAAIGIGEFLRRKQASLLWMVIPLVVITALNVNRNRLRNDHWPWVEYGRTARIEYFQTKSWLLRHRNETLGNNFFSQSVAPWLDVKMLLPVLRILDSNFVTMPLAIKPVAYVENLVNTRIWGPIVSGRPAVQTFVLDRARILTNLELLAARTGSFNGSVTISLLDTDGGRVLWELRIPSQLWPNDTWLAVPVDLVRLEPRHVYSLQVASTSNDPAATVTLWMNDRPDSYPDGRTRTPDGVTGSLCFRLSFIDP